MLNVTSTKGFISKVKQQGNLILATFKTAKKVNEQWVNMYWNAKFVGKSKEEILSCPDRTKVEIINAIVEQNKYNDKYYTNLVIFDYVILDKPEAETEYPDETELPF